MINMMGIGSIEILGFEIIRLISAGYSETVDCIIEKMGDGNLIEYIRKKYKDVLVVISDNAICPYDFAEWENKLDEYSYMTFSHDVVRKCGIADENHGLLLLSAIVLEIVAQRR